MKWYVLLVLGCSTFWIRERVRVFLLLFGGVFAAGSGLVKAGAVFSFYFLGLGGLGGDLFTS